MIVVLSLVFSINGAVIGEVPDVGPEFQCRDHARLMEMLLNDDKAYAGVTIVHVECQLRRGDTMTNPHGGYGWRRSLPDYRDAPFTVALDVMNQRG